MCRYCFRYPATQVLRVRVVVVRRQQAAHPLPLDGGGRPRRGLGRPPCITDAMFVLCECIQTWYATDAM